MFLQKCCTTRVVIILTVIVALLFGGSLLLAFWGIPKIIKNQIHSNTQLKNGTDQWDRFVETPFPLQNSIRFFHVTNPDDVLNGVKPILQETDPYTYNLTLKKQDLRFDDDAEDSVTYHRQMSFEFDDSGTTQDTDEVTVINSVLLSALQLSSAVQRLAFAGCIDKILTPFGMGSMFITKPVKEILFDGVDFSFANYSELGYACKIVRNKMIPIIGGIRVIEQISTNGDGNDYLKFSAFNYKTDSYTKDTKPDGIYTVNRGIKDMTQLGSIMRWNGETHLDLWGNSQSSNNDTCNQIGGTDSTIYRPQIDEGADLTIFNTDICRTVKLIYKSSGESYKGVKGYRYETSPKTFRPSTASAEHDCFCSKATKDVSGKDNCYLDGVFDFKPCLGAPILISQPHFLNADEHYLTALDGLAPNESKHGIYLILEPNTGTPLEGMKRIQLNNIMRKESLISFITPANMYEAVIPLLWLEEGVNLPQEYVDLVNKQYFKAVKIGDGVKYALIALFAALLAVCLFFVWRIEYFKRKST